MPDPDHHDAQALTRLTRAVTERRRSWIPPLVVTS